MRDSRLREAVEGAILKLFDKVAEICPEAKIRCRPTFIEDYDVKVEVIVPDGTPEEVEEKIEDAGVDVQDETGVKILLGIWEETEYDRMMRRIEEEERRWRTSRRGS